MKWNDGMISVYFLRLWNIKIIDNDFDNIFGMKNRNGWNELLWEKK
jgi:hypothetical protein